MRFRENKVRKSLVVHTGVTHERYLQKSSFCNFRFCYE